MVVVKGKQIRLESVHGALRNFYQIDYLKNTRVCGFVCINEGFSSEQERPTWIRNRTCEKDWM